MNNLRIPAWLVALAGVSFILIILEQLYISKRPVDLWGLQLNQPPTEREALGIANVPVGSILAWHRDLFGVPKLPAGWVRSDGQRIEDKKSPLYGQVLPDLNGKGLFLRGNAESGEVQEQGWKSLSVVSHRVKYTHGPVTIPKNGSGSRHIFAGEWNSVVENGANVANGLQFTFDASEVRPKNFSVVWVVRIF